MKLLTGTKSHQLSIMLQLLFILIFAVLQAVGAEDVPTGPLKNGGQADPSVDPAIELSSTDEYGGGPHHQLACARCHRDESENSGQAEESVNDESIRLCEGCHPVEHLHPVGVEMPQYAGGTVSLPLGKGELTGKIVCFTCHAIHQKLQIPLLLRGKGDTYSRVRNSLCLGCHKDQFQGNSPHAAENGCVFCHAVKPEKKEKQFSKAEYIMQAACNLCHPNLSGQHFRGMNPFIDLVIRRQAEQEGFLATDGRPVCTSCHEPHPREEGIYFLKGAYLSWCGDSRSVNPHWNNFLCLSCHTTKPLAGTAPRLREEGDRNKICNRCHHSDYARTDIHPVGIPPSEHIQIPADMPLQKGTLTCDTCHDPLLQMGSSMRESDPAHLNPHFLRKKSVPRNAFCFLCHIEETYKRLNPHIQLDAEGIIREENCLFCHATIPDVRFIGPEKVSFIVQNPNEYCVGCHHGFTGNHPAGVKHLVKPSVKIMKAIKTSVQRIGVELPLFRGEIVCATCHNPHQTGVIKIAAAATGTQRENKLRLKPGRRQCTGCHWDK